MQIKAKFLIIRFSSIGDIVLTSPVIRCLKEQFEGEVSIHLLTKKSFYPIFQNNPYIDQLHGIENSTNEVIDDLKNEGFDFVIDLHNNLRSLRIKRKLQLVDMSFKKLNWEKWLKVNLKLDRLPKEHIVDRYLATLAPWGVKSDGKGLDYFLSDEEEFMTLPDFFQKPYIALTVGGGHATKTMPVEGQIQLIKKLDLGVVLLGGAEDVEKSIIIENALGEKVWNACGKFSLNESAVIVKRASLIISHDTGLMHIASAFSKPIISIWGNTIPEFGMYPYMPQCPERSVIIEVKDLSCRPCSKLGYNKCPKKHFNCMNQIDLDLVSRQAKVLLKN